jgi:phosphoglycolate phosphatase-like HAD superfamily hydrolase
MHVSTFTTSVGHGNGTFTHLGPSRVHRDCNYVKKWEYSKARVCSERELTPRDAVERVGTNNSVPRKIYETRYLHSVKAFEDVRQVFETLTRRGGKIALATDCKGPQLKHYLSLLDIDEFIEATACGDDVEHGKPDTRLVGLSGNWALPGPGPS